MNLTAQDFIVDALSLIGATQMDQTPPAWEMSKALRALNHMLNTWSAHKLMIRAGTQQYFTLTASKGSYTIGESASLDVNSAKPLKILSAFIRDGSDDHPLTIIEKSHYDGFSDKTLTGMPDYLAYDPGVAQQTTQTGTIYLYYEPDSAYVLYITSQKFLTEFSALTTTFTFEPQYGEAIKYNLAIRLWPFYRKPGELIPPSITDPAADGVRIIKALNSEQVRCKIDIPCAGGSYNIYTDE